jgi:hypothetical protein
MQTTLDLEDDILSAIEAIAQRQGTSIGKVLSDLARQALAKQDLVTVRNGIPLFPIQPKAGVVTMDIVNQLRDEAP